jgi:hypothetical protein
MRRLKPHNYQGPCIQIVINLHNSFATGHWYLLADGTPASKATLPGILAVPDLSQMTVDANPAHAPKFGHC